MGGFTTIKARIVASFALLVSLFLISAVFNTYIIQRSEDVIASLYEEKDPSLTVLNDLKMLVSRARELTTNWVYLTKNIEDKEELKNILEQDYPVVREKLNRLAGNWDTKTADTLQKAFEVYDMINQGQEEIMHNLATFEDYENPLKIFAAEEKLEFHVLPLSNRLVADLDNIIEEKKREKNLARENLITNNRYIRISIVASGLVILTIAIVISILTAIRVTRPVKKVQDLFEDISRGILPENISHNSSDEIGKMIGAVNRLVQGLKETSRFAQDIGEGRFDTPYTPLSNKDMLGNSLITMRGNLLNVAEEDKNRNWANEGYAHFMEILRSNNDSFEKLGNTLISELVKYLNANQGGLFILQEEPHQESFMRLAGCYAWDRKKYVNKKIYFGEGQVGQVWREGDTVLLTDVPDDYINITSGLGKATPHAILIIPMKFNEKVYGVIELASFEVFEEYQIEFLKRLSDSVASTISTVTINQRTQQLLKASQQQSEKLSVKDEEMRQNMEEMRATQEDSQRKEQEYLQRIAELENQLSEITNKA